MFYVINHGLQTENVVTADKEKPECKYVVRKEGFKHNDLTSSVPVFETEDIIQAVKLAKKLSIRYGTFDSSYVIHADNNRCIVDINTITFAHNISRLYERDMYVVPGINYAEVVFSEEINNRSVFYTVKYQAGE